MLPMLPCPAVRLDQSYLRESFTQQRVDYRLEWYWDIYVHRRGEYRICKNSWPPLSGFGYVQVAVLAKTCATLDTNGLVVAALSATLPNQYPID